MSDDRDQKINQNDFADDVAAADDRAAAAEAAEVARDDALVDEQAEGAEVTIPPTAPIAQPDPIPPDGVD